YPTYDLPEIVIETKIPEDYPTIEKPEGQIGIVPKDYPTYDLPEIIIETKIPEDYPVVEKPEGQIGLVPKDYPTYDLPEIVIETKIPEDYPTVEKPEGQIGLVPKDYPTYDLPEIVIDSKILENYTELGILDIEINTENDSNNSNSTQINIIKEDIRKTEFEKGIKSIDKKSNVATLPKTSATTGENSNSTIPLALSTILLTAGLISGKRKKKNNQ
ncbi:MAG: LPXTG cell wall anchor domain-containing protein, partial [Gemella sp.]|nr:LPXTG cell wall anchor domain-containing protein [Gemella sp.]